MFFRLSTWELWLIVASIVLGFVAIGYLGGRVLRNQAETLREPVGIVQGAFFALVGLVLAFGLTLALGRYDARRTAVVDDANTIGSTFLRAQTLREPERTQSIGLLRQYGTLSLQLAHEVPDSGAMNRTVDAQTEVQRALWSLAGKALARAPQDTAPRLYVESLNEMIDQRTTRVSSLRNRIPSDVLALELVGSAIALALLTLYLELLGRGRVPIGLAAVLVGSLLFVTFDLDRPHRGLINVPAGPLVSLQHELAEPTAAAAP